MRFTAIIQIAVIAAAVSATRVSGQTVNGVVRDSASNQPVPGVTVELISLAGQSDTRDVTDGDGLFTLQGHEGAFRIRLQRIGYASTFSRAFKLAAGRDTIVSIRVSALAVGVAPLTVSASTLDYLKNSGFYDRKSSETGRFLDPSQVSRLTTKTHQTADLLDGIPGVTLLSVGGSAGLRIPMLNRQLGCDIMTADLNGGATVGPRIYLDGHRMNPPGQNFDVNTIQALEIAAVEVYRHTAEVPLRFGGGDASCGALVIWTKH